MKRNGWHIHREAGRYVLARQWPPRFDIVAEARFPAVRPDRLALQVRQDVWRCLKRLHTFSPVVDLSLRNDEIVLRAGGRMTRPAPPGTEARLTALLNDPARRARWIAWAGRGRP